MGAYFEAYLEYDGKNPVKNDFICCLTDECCCSTLKKWNDLYKTDNLQASSGKKHSFKLEKAMKGDSWSWMFDSWGLSKIILKIKSLKKEWGLDENLEYIDEDDKEEMKGIDYDLHHLYAVNIVCDLRVLYDLSMEKCVEQNLEPEKCYVVWWINY